MYPSDVKTPASEIARRIERLQQQLRRNDIEAALIVQNTDLFYFSGTLQQAHLYVPAQGDPLLMARKDFKRAQAESPITKIIPLDSPKQILPLLADHGISPPHSLGLELDVLPANLFLSYQALFKGARIMDASHAIRLVRAIKSDYEIDLIRTAAAHADSLAARLPEFIREGMSELELAGKIEAVARGMGHQGIIRMRIWGGEMFYGHLAAGAAAATPSFLASPTGGVGAGPAVSQGASRFPIRRNTPILFDYVFVHNGYMADHTRIFSLGKIADDLQQAHTAALEIQASLIAAARPGAAAGSLYESACAHAARLGYEDYFLGVGPQRIRFVGHGLGLEIDEYPILAQGQDMPLEPGMVIALEPKFVFPQRGVVGIENTFVMTSDGLEQLTLIDDQIKVI